MFGPPTDNALDGTVNEYHSKREDDVATATPQRNKNVTRQAVDPH